ncbi:MAG TPA: exodeoxyribonuclease V subunit alpha [Rhodanobacteraceae bacterium]|nr:exodeoxyribonuclease V subunit alpha [Rhodanobacteraceae bacterium]
MNSPITARDGLIAHLQRLHALRPLDAELGRLMLQLDAGADVALGLAAAAVSQAVAQGHSCLPLDQLPAILAAVSGTERLPPLPDATALRAVLRASPLIGDPATSPRARLPLWLDAADRLYLGRYYHYEARVADVLRRLATAPPHAAMDAATLHKRLSRHFRLEGDRPDWQAVAVATGLLSRLTVITGGPGTGKTTTVLWLLAALLEQAREDGQEPPRICLAAPTGKAAARLGESLRERLPQMDVDTSIREAMPQAAYTLHRLLGVRAGSSRFRHDRTYPLDADVVVVDEASMVDLPLMAKLLDALPERASLVLLGDRDQLASVEAGNVLAGICAAAGEGALSPTRASLIHEATGFDMPSAAQAGAFADAVIELRDSHRFGADSGLGQLAAQVRRDDTPAVLDGLAQQAFAGVSRAQPSSVVAHVLARSGETFAELATMTDPARALAQASRLRVLTALREGPSGCVTLNAAIEHFLRQRAGAPARSRWYSGRLLLVTVNDPGSGLFNGDIGIVLPVEGDRLAAWFPAADGGVRSLPLSALPAHDSAFAMTIHKSQGSEFDEIIIALPQEDARVLGRELLYTAVTRARTRVHLVANDKVLAATISRSTRRFSGLADRLVDAG